MNLKDNPLITALRNRQPTLAISLIEAEENVNVADEYGFSALMLAVDFESVFQAILEKKPNTEHLDNKGQTVLHSIALHGTVAELNALVAYGVKPDEINRQNNKGEPPLLLAASNEEVFEALILLGANLHLKDNNGETIAHKVADLGTVYELELLSKLGINLNVEDNWGDTPLHVAASYGLHHTVDALIKLGANINAKNQDGETPLHYAINNQMCSFEVEDHIKAIKILIQFGADIQAKTYKGETPLQLAQQYGNHSPYSILKEVLIASGAK